MGAVTFLGSLMVAEASRSASFQSSGSLGWGILSWVPTTTMALSFLLPATAPVPPRPAARSSLLIQLAKRTRFSPAGPMAITSASSPCRSRRMRQVSWVVLPQRSEASWMETSPSFTRR